MANTLGALAGAAAYRRFSGHGSPDYSARSALAFLVSSGFVLSGVATLGGLISLQFGPSLPAGVLTSVGFRWFLSDVTGAVLLAPILLNLMVYGRGSDRATGSRAMTAASVGYLCVLVWVMRFDLRRPSC